MPHFFSHFPHFFRIFPHFFPIPATAFFPPPCSGAVHHLEAWGTCPPSLGPWPSGMVSALLQTQTFAEMRRNVTPTVWLPDGTSVSWERRPSLSPPVPLASPNVHISEDEWDEELTAEECREWVPGRM